MEPEVEKPSFDDIRHALLSSIDYAEDFAFRHPEHADAVTRLLQRNSGDQDGVDEFI